LVRLNGSLGLHYHLGLTTIWSNLPLY